MKNYLRMLISQSLKERAEEKTLQMDGEVREIYISGYKRINDKYQSEVNK